MTFREELSGFSESRPPESLAATRVPALSKASIETYVSTAYTRHSRLILHEEQSYRGLPVNVDSESSPLDREILEAMHKRHSLAVQEFGASAVMLRCDWEAGTPQEALQDLMTRLQDQAGRKETRLHFMIVAEFVEGQVGNHFHACIWFDESKLDYPHLVNRMWKKIMKAHELPDSCRIIWRRDNHKPFRFQIGQTQEEFKKAFYAASYVAKTSQPPLTTPAKRSRIVSRTRNDVFRLYIPEEPRTRFQLILADDLNNVNRSHKEK